MTRRLLSLWFGVDARVSRRAYAASGFSLMALKYAVEATVVHAVAGRWPSPLDYLSPLLAARAALVRGHDWLLWALVLWTLPFLWIGVSMTLRRAEDAGRSRLLAALYFVPIFNYVLMLVLCLLPSRPGAVPPVPAAAMGAGPRRDSMRSALLGAGLGVLIALLMVGGSVLVFGSYGTTLFVATPFVMGAASAHVFNRARPRPLGTTLLVALLGVGLGGGALLLFALEGLVCLAMAAPLGVALALTGGLLGRALALRAPGAPAPARALLLAIPLPLLAGVDATRQSPAAREVVTVVDVKAPPRAVWPHVVTFDGLPEPPPLPFRLGLAYPRRATIDRRGVGAVRRCEFSTGAFVEPITAWDEPLRLAFDVASQPPPLRELSPFGALRAPHLDGYLVVRSGEFLLQALPGGGTRLVGRTRYELAVFPEVYWGAWTDAVIHAIHRRVLSHILEASEAGRRPA